MGERTRYEPGTFSWVDLSTNDQDAAKAFYAELLGWDYEDNPIGDGMLYTMARLRGRNVAAIFTGREPPHWNSYVTVEDADASAQRARDLGATVLVEPMDVFDAGRMAVLQDPQGAVLSLWQPGANIGAGLVNEVGALSWNDLLSADVEGSIAFYSALLGWTIQEVPGSDGQYYGVLNGENRNGGIMPMAPGGHPAWNLYFATADTDATVAKAQELGAEVVMGPMDVPASRFAILRDPQGAVFSVGAGDMDP
jgi:uncharacterized protein